MILQHPVLRRLLGLLGLLAVGTFGLASTVVAAPVDPSAEVHVPANLPGEIDPLAPASSGGAVAVDRALARLATHRRLLMIAAHPDDEDTFVLAHVARSLGGEAAYLSLTRGDGGQNLIGEELGIGLGLLRSRELEAARSVDGARQFFSRAYDFGYTRSMAEAFDRWPKETLLADAEHVVRRFAPQVIVAVFPPDERAGHGQHQASGAVAEEIFRRFDGAPGSFVRAFYRAAWWDPEASDVVLDLGIVDPWSGRSAFQIALASRSRHRCQDMGYEQPPGEFRDALSRLGGTEESGVGDGDDLFVGIDTSLAAIAEPLADAELRRALAVELEGVESTAREARSRLVPADLGASVESLAAIVDRLLGALETLDAGETTDPARETVRRLVSEKLAIAREGLAAAAFVVADAVSERETVVAGGTLGVRALFWNAGEHETSNLEVDLLAQDGFRVASSAPAEPARGRFATRLTDERRLEIAVDPAVEPSVPYFLHRPRAGDLYDWTHVDPAVRGLPFGPPPLRLRFRFDVAGAPVEIVREVVHRYRDQAVGEVRRPVRVVPAVEVSLDRDFVVWPLGRRSEATLRVLVRSHLAEPVNVALAVDAPTGWSLDAPDEVAIVEPEGRRTVEIVLRPPVDAEPGRFEIAVSASVNGATYDRALELIDYPHIRPVTRPVRASATLATGEIALPALDRVGYVRGASDRVPEALAEIGLDVELLGPEALADADLSVYDVLVIGSRAYEVEPELARANARLLDYARNGGTLVVQYQQYGFVEGALAPYPLEIDRPHGRVTDETAPARRLVPEHPAFTSPNRLTAEDWRGWVQERGLYFAGSFDERYTPLVAFADPDREEERGALLVAELGEGRYVYTGLAFFRQLPAGVVGAYRLFANLLALAEDEREENGDGVK